MTLCNSQVLILMLDAYSTLATSAGTGKLPGNPSALKQLMLSGKLSPSVDA